MRVAAIWMVALLLLATVPAAMGQGIISTVAGKPWVFTGDGGPATNAPLGGVAGTALDSSGNLYVADPHNNIVVKITPGGVLTIMAGGPGMTPLSGPSAVAVDASGNLYVAELWARRVSKIGSGGTLTLIAGNGGAGFNGDNLPATAAELDFPSGLAFDAAGNLYISDRNNNRIRKVSGGVITTYAGNGTATYAGENVPATSASLNQPWHIALDSAGNLYIADWNNGRIRKVDHSTLYISTVAGGGTTYPGDGGPATVAQLKCPAGVAVDSTGSTIFVATVCDSTVWKIVGGTLSRYAGTSTVGFSGDIGPATQATLSLLRYPLFWMGGLAIDSNGSLFIADRDNLRIRKVNSSGTITTFAGNGKYRFDGDGGPATAASLQEPVGIVFDSSGSLYIGDFLNNRVRKITSAGIISTFAGNGVGASAGDNGPATAASLNWPNSVAVDSSGNLYISQCLDGRVRKVTPGGTITTFAGGGTSLGDNGPATLAQLASPGGIVFDAADNMYVADSGHARVRKIDHLSGYITTVAGFGLTEYAGDNGPATAALLNNPDGLALDSTNGFLYIVDRSNSVVRKVTLSTGIITTVAGTGAENFSGDGGPATAATLFQPAGVALDSSGNFYITDLGNNRVRRVDKTTGIITTVAGGGITYPGDGLLATNAQLSVPWGITLDTAGNLYVAEFGGNLIRKITNPSTPAFGLSVSPASQTVNAGLSTSYTVTITAAAGFSSPVTLSCSGLPTGATCSFSPNPASPGTSALTVTTTAGSTPAGTTTFTITGTSGALSYNTTATLIVTNPDFLISVSPSSQTVAAGLKTTYTVTVTPVNGLTSGVVLSCSSGLPSGASCSFLPNPTSSTSTLTVGTSVSTPLTGATLTITGAAGALSHSTSTMLVVTTAAAPASLAYVSGNSQSGPAGAALPNPLAVRVTDSSTNPIAGVTVTFTVTGGGGTLTPTSALTDYNGLAQAGWTLGSTLGANAATASVSGLSPVSFSATASAPVAGPGITTVAGSTWVFPSSAIGGPATSAPLGWMYGLAADSTGNVYVPDSSNQRVFKISAGGVLSVVAGTGTAGFSGDSGQATAAQLSSPYGVALDSSGNLYIADSGNNRIRRVNLATGIISTFAGTGSCTYSGDGVPATSTPLCSPSGVFADGYGNLYIADTSNNRVRKVSTSGIISTVAGNGTWGTSGDNGPATAAQLDYPYAVAVDLAGNLYIGSGCCSLRKVDPSGVISTVPGTSYGEIGGLAMDAAGNLYIGATESGRVIKMDTSGALTTIAGTGSWGFSGDAGPATGAQLNLPYGVAVDLTGNVYIADSWNYRVRKVSGGTITTIGGNGLFKFGGDTGAATAAYLNEPYGVVSDAAGNLYIADAFNNRIRKVDKTTGNITTIAGTGAAGYSGDNSQATAARMFWPAGVALDGAGNLYIGDVNGNRVRKLNLSTGVITTVAGGGGAYPGDGGPATAATVGCVRAIALDTAGNLYIAGFGGNRVRKVDTSGIITTVAGNGTSGYSGDGGPATAAMLSFSASGVAVDASGNIYIADAGNYRVRKVDTSGIITTVAGTGSCCSSGDGGPATAATLYPGTVAVDASGNIYISDSSRIRKITPGGIITTVAGSTYGFSGDSAPARAPSAAGPNGLVVRAPGAVSLPGGSRSPSKSAPRFSGDRGPALSAQMADPQGIWVDSSGNIFIADTYNDRIRLVSNSITFPDFSLSASPASQTVAAGLAAVYTVTVTGIGGFTNAVTLSCSGLPSGASCSFLPNPAFPGNSALTLSTSTSLPQGIYAFSVTGTSSATGTTHWAPTSLTVTTAADFSLAVTPSSRTVAAGLTAGYSVSITPINGFNLPVTLSCSSGGGGGAGSGTGPCPGTPITDGQTVTGNLASDCPSSQRPGRYARYYTFTATAGQPITIAMNAVGFYDTYLYLMGPSGSVVASDDDSGGNLNSLIRYTAQAAGTYTIEATSFAAGATGSFTLSLTLGLPGGISCSFTPNPASPGTATMTASTTIGAPAGTLGFVVTGTAGAFGHSTAVSLTVTAPAAPASITIVTGNNQSGPAGSALPNPLVVRVADASSNPIAGVAVTFAITAGGGAIIPSSATTDSSGQAQAGWVLGTTPGANTATASVASLSAITFTATGTQAPAGPGVTTVAGSTWVFPASAFGGPATSAPLGTVQGVATGTAGNVYVADTGNQMVFKISGSGVLSLVAGTGTAGFSGDNGPATAAALAYPSAVAVDTAGNVYIADSSNNRIRKVAASTGIITTVAGTGSWGYSGDSGPATAAQLAYPRGVAVDAAGNLYIADTNNNRVRKVNTSGIITTVAGIGTATYTVNGYSHLGDGGPATAAEVLYPVSVAVDPAGNLYIGESPGYIRKVSAAGTITTLTLSIPYIGEPVGLATDAAGNLYIAGSWYNTVSKVDTSGTVTTIAGVGASSFSGDSGPATAAALNLPSGVAVDSAGSVYIADTYNYRVRKVSGGIINTIGGNGLFRFGGDSGPATSAQLSSPYGVVSDAAGNFYIADYMNHRVRRVASNGTITTIAGTGVQGYSGDNSPATAAMLARPTAVALDAVGNLYVADNYSNRIRKLNLASGIITTVAGTGSCCYGGDGGPATAAWLDYPRAVALDAAGNLYIAEYNRIRKVNTSGIITTVAGSGGWGYSGDGGPATLATFDYPAGVAVDSTGNIYIADIYNYRVRKVDTSGIITTIAGNGSYGPSGDGGPATAASLYPEAVAVDAAGNIYISDTWSSRIRKVTPGGIITTVAGTWSGFSGDSAPARAPAVSPYGVPVYAPGGIHPPGGSFQKGTPGGIVTPSAGARSSSFSGDRGPALSAQFAYPEGIWVDGAGNLFIADTGNHRIRKVSYSIAVPDFSLAITPPSQTITAGLSATYTVQITGIAGFTSPVTLALSGLPSNAFYSFSAYPATPGNVTLLVNTSINTPPGSSTLTVTGTSGSLIRVATATFTVTPAPVPASLTIVSGNNQSGPAGAALPNPLVVRVADASNNPIAGVPVTFAVTAGGGTLTPTSATTGTNGVAQAGWTLGSGLGTNTATATVTGLSTVTFNATASPPVVGPGITTVAGSTWVFPSSAIGGPATSAPLGYINSVAVDSSLNAYVADGGNNMVFKVTPGGLLSVVAGTGTGGYSGDNGQATAAKLSWPTGLALDTSGNLLIADTGNNRIRKVNLSTGIISTYAGTGWAGYWGDSGQATSARLSQPQGVFADASGNLYIADTDNNRVRKVNASGVISTVAGNGTAGTSGDSSPATSAQLNHPYGVAVDSTGNLYIGSDCCSVRKVDPSGIITTVPGTAYGVIGGLTTDAAGNLYIVASQGERVTKMDPSGTLTTIAGTGSWGFSGDAGPATNAQLYWPWGVAVDSAGNIYIADTCNYRVRKVTGGTVTTIAGNGLFKYGGDNGAATAAYLNSQYGVVGDTSGNLYVADTYNNRIRKFSVGGSITTIAGTGVGGYSGDDGPATAARLAHPLSVALDGAGNLYIADTENVRIRRLNLSSGIITTVAGNGIYASSGDSGPATAASLSWPNGLAVDSSGNIYIADSGNHRIRKVSSTGIMTTVAGMGTAGYSGDGGPATAAMLSWPNGVAVDASGNIYVGDSDNYRVRKVDTSGIITTIAGNGTSGFSGDRGLATAASLRYPDGISVDASGNLFIADRDANRIRKVTPGGIITTVAGTSSWGFSGDGGPAISAWLNAPQGVWVNAAGDLFIADTDNDRIRLVSNSIALPDFSLAITPASQTITAGLSATYTVQITGIAGFTSPVTLTLSGLPSNTTYSFSANPATPGNVTLLVNTSISTPAGSSTLTVTGTSGSLIRVATSTLAETAAATPASLTIVSGNNQTGAAGAALPNPLVVKVADSSGNPIAGVGVSFAVTGGGGSLGSTAVTTGSDGQAATAWILGPTPATNRATATVTGLSTVTFTATGTQAPAGPGITTIAGSNWVFSSAGTATSAPFGTIQGTAVDSAGNVYVADSDNDMVFKITPGGTLSIVAGTGVAGAIGDGGAATAAQLNFPNGVAVDTNFNVYIADRDNHRIRKVTPGGTITTLAGGSNGYAGDSGPAALAQFYYPAGVAVDTFGNLYIADRDNHVIREISTGGIVSTVAGNGINGYSGDSGPATAAQLNSPNGVAVDSAGNLYIADTSNHRIRQVAPAGIISTVAGTGTTGYSGDSGAATSARLNSPSAVTVDSSGNLFIADQSNNRIRKVTSGGTISTLAGSGSRTFSGDAGQATSAALNMPYGVAVDSTTGNVYIGDQYNYRVRKVASADGTISTFGGNGLYRIGGDGGLATSAQLSTPRGMVADTAGNLYIADYANHRVRKVTSGGVITTIAGTGVYGYSGDNGPATMAMLAYPGGVALDAAGNLYVGDQGNHRVRKIDTSGVITTVVGTGSAGSSGDGGLATAAQLNNPRGVVFDSNGNLYIADSSNNRVRKVTPSGAITTVAGTGTSGYAGDGGAATLALLRGPWGVAVDSAGNLYIAEHDNHTVRKVDSGGTITTLAGTGSYGCSGNAVAAASSTFYNVLSVGVDSAGNVYFADELCHRVRKVTPTGAAVTVAGTGSAGFAGDGGPASLAQLRNPQGVWVDASGNVYVSDSLNHRIRLVSSSVSVPDFALSLSPASQTVTAGLAITFTATVAASGGFNSPVNLSCSGLPVGASCSFSPNPALPGNSTLKLSVPLNATPATFNFTVIATSGSLIRVATGSVTSTSPAAPAALAIVSGNNQSAPAGRELPNPIVVQVADAGSNPLAGVAVSFSVASGGGSLGQTLVMTDGNGKAQAVWTLGTYPGTNTATAAVAGLSPVTFTSSGTLASAGPGITTVAGSTWSFSGAGGPATNAPLGYTWRIALDAAGNLFVADGGNYMVLKISTTGIVTVVAGTGTSGFSGDGGPATSAQLASVVGVAVDSSGNVYITDQGNQRIRKVDISGIITTVAGTGTSGYAGDGGPATLAQVANPYGLAVDAAGNLYIADSSNNRVRKVTPAGVISTVAGSGAYGFTGDGGPAVYAQLRSPNAVAFDASGNMYIADSGNNRVRKVDSSGIITTIAGTGTAGYTSGGGSATSARLYNPGGLAVDASGNLYIADQNNNRIRKVTSGGAISTVAGNGARGFWGDSGSAALAALNYPLGVAVDASGNVYIGDSYNYRIRKVNTAGIISTIAGNGMFRYGGDGGPATSAQLYSPRAGVSDAAGNIYIADTSNHRIRKVTPGGTITTIAGTGLPGYSGDGGPATAAMLYSPYGLAVDAAGNIFIADTSNNRIRRIDSAGTITTVAGSGVCCNVADGGPATLAWLSGPRGLWMNAGGSLYIGDLGNYRVRKVDAGGTITTVAGNGTYGYAGDGGPATLAPFTYVYGVVGDAVGSIYVADSNNYRIRKVDTAGIVTTIAGTGTNACSGASGPAASLSLTNPWGLALDSAGNLYFADLYCHRIRRLAPGGTISTVAGNGSSGFSGDGGPATIAMLDYPTGVWLDSAGNVFLADGNNHRIRKISSSILVPDFTVAVSPGSATLAAGLSSTHTVTITALNGLSSSATLGCSGLPAGASCSFSPRSLVSGTSTLTLSTGVGTPTGTVSFSVTASGGGLVRVAPASLTVTTAVAPASLVVVSGNDQTGPAGSTLPNMLVVKVLDAASNPISGVPISLTVTAGGGSFQPGSPRTGPNGQAPFAWTLGSSTGANSATASVTGLTPVTLSAIATAPLTGPPITTIAGRAWLFSGDGGPATSAWGIAPMYGVTAGPSGSVYVAASENNLVFKVSSAGILNIVAGNGTPGFSGDGGLAISAQLNGPYRLAVDAAGNLYIADLRNHRVRKVSANGTITTVAGNGTGSYSGDGGPATAAGLVSPAGLALDAAGNLYIADMDDHRIRKVNTSGIITTVGGIGIAGYYGDGGQAAFAQFSSPRGLAIDSSGNIYVADGNNNRIRRINTAGTVTTVAGNGNYGYSGDGGSAVNAWLENPLDVTVDSSGSLYIADRGNNRIRKITSGTISTIAGSGTEGFSGDAGPATAASLDEPAGVSVDSAGNIYIADGDNFRVRKVAPGGIITTIAGNGNILQPLGDGGPATAAFLLGPAGLALDAAGSLYIAEDYVGRVRKMAAGGTISTYAGGAFTDSVGDGGPATAARLDEALGMVVDSAGNLYIAEGHGDRIRKVTPGGIISTIAGVGSAGFSGDGGPATAANLNYPAGLALDAAGNLYFSDQYNHRIRKVDLSGTITTVAGSGIASYYGDTSPAMAAGFNQPIGIAFDGSGNLYIADQGNNRIRKIDTSGIVTTVAGSGTAGCDGDGGPARGAFLSSPSDIRIDAAGNLYIVDTGCNRIRKVTSGGVITTVAGTGLAGSSGDGGPAVNAQLTSPAAILLDPAGNILISDQGNLRVRKVWSGAAAPTDFALGISPMWRAAPAGSATSFAVTIAPMGGFNAPVSLTCGGLPAGASCTFSPNPANPGTATLTVGVGSTLSGMFTFSVTGTSGALVHTEGASVTVTPPPASLVVVSGNNQSGPASATLPNPVVVRALDANGVPVPGAQVTFATSGGAFVPSIAITDANGVATAGWTLAPAPGANSGTATTPGLSPVSLAATGTTPGPLLGITTIAGSTWNFYGNGGPATNAPLGLPQAGTADASGNVYIADAYNNMVFKVTPAGVLTIVAGDGTKGYSGDGGPATAAQLSFVSDVAPDAAGNLYIADSVNNRIRKVDTSGIITTIAGNGTAAFSGDNGPGTLASLKGPYGIVLDSSGNVYIADSSNNRIRLLDTSGTITTIAGGGTATGDGGAATNAALVFPTRAVPDSSGNLYIAEMYRVRKVTGGIITTVAGTGTSGPSSGDGGAATNATFSSVWGLTVDAAGNIYVADAGANRVRKISGGVITTVAGNGANDFSGDGGPATAACLSFPESPTLDAAGNVYIFDEGNQRVRKVAPDGTITTFAGNGRFKSDGDGGPATQAHYYTTGSPSVSLDNSGNLYIFGHGNIRKVTPAGTISTVAGRVPPGFSGDGGPATLAQMSGVTGVADAGGNVYLSDLQNNRIRKIGPSGVITTIAGTGVAGYSGDGGPATAAQLNTSNGGLAIDAAGNLYIADNGNNRIRKVDTQGTITTLAGTGTSGYSGDGGPATSAQINKPRRVALDSAGNVYFSDSGNVVRRIDGSGVITTIAGNGTSGYSGDGGPATGAQLRSPTQIGFDAAGNLYISDSGNYRVRMVTPGGVITTVAGNGVSAFSGDGGVATSASLSSPNGLAVDSSGNIYIGDGDHVRKIWAFTNPVPAVSALTPATVPTGAALTLIVTGSGFSQGSVVRWNGSDRPTTFVSTTQLTAAIPASDLPAAGTAQITVFSPAPGGGTSNAMVLTIVTANPLPIITSISPVERTAGSGGFPLTVNGLSFVTGATVQWAGSPRPTTYVSGSQLTAQVSDADAATAGMFLVTVVNPAPGGGTSAGTPFTIHPVGSYLVGDASPAGGNDSGRFGDESLDNPDLILALRAVTSVPGFLPPNCADLFDAMDSYPTDGEARGGDASLDNLDLIATLRRVTNADPSRPRRTPRGLVCSAMAPGLVAMLARPAELTLGAGAVEFQREQSGEDGAARVAVYLAAYRDLDLGGLSLALGWTDSSPAAQAALHFIPAAAGAPALLDNGLPGTIAAAWLGGLQLRAGQRLLLGFVHISTSGQQVALPVLYGAMANDRATGARIPLELRGRERSRQ